MAKKEVSSASLIVVRRVSLLVETEENGLVFFPKQLTVGVLNATLDLAALVLVGVVGFLGSEVVLSPVVSGCLPSCGGWVLVGVVGLGSEVVLSPIVSHCLRLSPFMWGVGGGWCGQLLGL